MIYIIDHKDSFTHNVVHQLSLFENVECDDFSKISKLKLNRASTIVFSPGPGSPKDYPLTSKIYDQFKGKKRIIGICLGFQQILFCEGGKIIEQNKIYHGFQSDVSVNNSSKLFKNGQISVDIELPSQDKKYFSLSKEIDTKNLKIKLVDKENKEFFGGIPVNFRNPHVIFFI